MAGVKSDIGEARKTGHSIFLGVMHNMLAEACLAAGAVPEGVQAIEQAMQVAQGGERLLEAESWRLKGELLRAGGDDDQAEQCFRSALKTAAAQSALSLELRSANSLARLKRDTGRAPDARELLKKTLERFTEGFDAVDLLEARLMLKDLE